jgi:phage terminase small subunit
MESAAQPDDAMLKPREEKFVQGLIAGLSQRKAFIEANPSAKRWKPETVDVKACHLFHQEDIQARYQELLIEARERSMWTREKAEETLTWLIEQAKEQIERTGRMESATVSAIMGAAKELNKMQGIGEDKLGPGKLEGLIGGLKK